MQHWNPLSPFDFTPLASASSIQAFPERKPVRSLFSWVSVILVTFAVIYSSIPARASTNGISGFSGKSGSTCTSCHSNGTPPTVTLTGPTTVASGSTNSYTLTVGGTGNHGLDVAASAGLAAAKPPQSARPAAASRSRGLLFDRSMAFSSYGAICSYSGTVRDRDAGEAPEVFREVYIASIVIDDFSSIIRYCTLTIVPCPKPPATFLPRFRGLLLSHRGLRR